MQEFKHVNAKSFAEASKELAEGTKLSAVAIAGGTDLMTEMRTRIQPVYPEKVVNLKTIEDSQYIKDENGAVTIGALTKLKDVEVSDKLPEVLKEAAHTATPKAAAARSTVRVRAAMGAMRSRATRATTVFSAA